MADYVELYLDQGTDFEATINIQDDTTNLPQNVDGYIVTSSLRKSILSQNSSANLVCSILDAPNGIIAISLDGANTALLKPGTYMFDVKAQINIAHERLVEGIITVFPAITK